MSLIQSIRELIFGDKRKFNEGDWVQCVDDSVKNNWSGVTLPISFGRPYLVKNVTYCKKCGNFYLDVDVKLSHDKLRTHCACSGRNGIVTLPGYGIQWLSAERFVKISKKKAEQLIVLNES
jgi:hypothetical protein